MRNQLTSIFVLLTLLCPLSLLADPQSITVGVAAPLSGQLSQMGEAFRRGYDLFQREHPNSPVKHVFEDHRYEGKDTLSALHKLRNVDRADLVVVWGNMPSSSAAPIAESSRIPLLGISMNPDAKDRQFVVTLGPPIEKGVETLFQQLLLWKAERPAAVTVDIGSAIKAVETLRDKLGGKLLIKTISSNESDFKTLIATLKRESIDALVLFAVPEQALTFLKQAKQMNFTPKILGGDVFADDPFQTASADLNGQIFFVYGAVAPTFLDKLFREFRNTSYFFETATGYSVAALVDQVSKNPALREDKSNILDLLTTANLAELPISNLRFLNDSTSGKHFESEAAIYAAPVTKER